MSCFLGQGPLGHGADTCRQMLMSCDNSPRTAGPKLGRPPQNRASLEAGTGETRAWISAFCEHLSLQAWRRGVGSVRMRMPVPGSQSSLLMSCACVWVGGACVDGRAVCVLQARLQQYVNRELPDVQAGFIKGRGTRDQIANIRWIIKKARVPEKHLFLLY